MAIRIPTRPARRGAAGIGAPPRLGRGWRWGAVPFVTALTLVIGNAAGASTRLTVAAWVIFAVLALSLDFIWGYGGIFSFGQAALFAIGAYAFAVLGINFGGQTNETLTLLVGASLIAGGVAAALGWFMFYGRVADLYVGIITLAFTLVLYEVVSSTSGSQYHIGSALLGGVNGIPLVPSIAIGVPGTTPWVTLDPSSTFFFAVCLLGLIYLALRTIIAGRFGRALRGIQANELRMELLGYDTRRYKTVAFAVGGVVAGLAGGTYAAWSNFVDPTILTLQQSALVLIWVLVGGRGTLTGAVLGALAVQWMTNKLGTTTTQTPLVLGILFILTVLVLPGGIVHTWRTRGRDRLWRLLWRRLPANVVPRQSPKMSAAGDAGPSALGGAIEGNQQHASQMSRAPTSSTLVIDRVVKRYGGVCAVDGVSARFEGPGAYCIIGPNGAGKSTLFAALSGILRPTSGSILLDGVDITRHHAHQRSRAGIGVKRQVPSVFLELSVAENMWLAANGQRDRPKAVHDLVDEGLDQVGLSAMRKLDADQLSHGQQQWLEIGMALVGGPRVLLLDEPTAGMTVGETMRTVELVRRLAEAAIVIVIEHDMNFVRELDAPVTILHQGKVFASGTVGELQADKKVQDIYLGRLEDAPAR